MKRDEPQESPKPPGAPSAGTTQELSREEILAFLEKMKKEGPEPEPHRPRKPPIGRG